MAHLKPNIPKRWLAPLLVAAAMLSSQAGLKASTPLRRPISPERPMHTGIWTAPDAERIIGMIPEDIRPYVVSNTPLLATYAFLSCLPSSSGCRHGRNQIYSFREQLPSLRRESVL